MRVRSGESAGWMLAKLSARTGRSVSATPLRKIDKSIPAELETITLNALAKEPRERYASAAELADDLRRWLGDQSIKAKPQTAASEQPVAVNATEGGDDLAAAVTKLIEGAAPAGAGGDTAAKSCEMVGDTTRGDRGRSRGARCPTQCPWHS